MNSIGLDERSKSMSSIARATRPGRPPRSVVHAVLAPPMPGVHVALIAVAAVCAATLGAIYAFVAANPQPQVDVSVERLIQSLSLGPLTTTFPFFSWVGGPGGLYMEVAALG